MKKIAFLILVSFNVFSQIQFTPTAGLTAGNSPNPTLAFDLNNNITLGVSHKHAQPLLLLKNSIDNIFHSIGYAGNFIIGGGTSPTAKTNFFTADQIRVSFTNSGVFFKKKLTLDRDLVINNSSKPLTLNGFIGNNGDIAVSSGSVIQWVAPPTEHPQNGFGASNSTILTFPNSTTPVILAGLTTDYNDQLGLDFYPSTGTYIAPSTGTYYFSCNINETSVVGGASNSGRIILSMLVNNIPIESTRKAITYSTEYTISLMSTIKLTAGDAVKFSFTFINDNPSANISITNSDDRNLRITGHKVY